LFVPFGGLISLVTTNLPDLSHCLNLDDMIPSPCLSQFSYLWSGNHMIILWGMIFPHQIEPALFFQSLINKSPGTILLLVHLTFALVGPSTGTIEQTLVAGGDVTNIRCLA